MKLQFLLASTVLLVVGKAVAGSDKLVEEQLFWNGLPDVEVPYYNDSQNLEKLWEKRGLSNSGSDSGGDALTFVGCQPHNCGAWGFFWKSKSSKVVVAGIADAFFESSQTHLPCRENNYFFIVTNAKDARLPKEAVATLKQWSNENSFCPQNATIFDSSKRKWVVADQVGGKSKELVDLANRVEKHSLHRLRELVKSWPLPVRSKFERVESTIPIGKFKNGLELLRNDVFEIEENGPPKLKKEDFATADKALNETYQKLISLKSLGEISKTIRAEQRLWLKYRDAWSEFGSAQYPGTPPDAWRAWLTQKRVRHLKENRPNEVYSEEEDAKEGSKFTLAVPYGREPGESGQIAYLTFDGAMHDGAIYTLEYGDGHIETTKSEYLTENDWRLPLHVYAGLGEFKITLKRNGTTVATHSILLFKPDLLRIHISSPSGERDMWGGAGGLPPLTTTYKFKGGTKIDFGDGEIKSLCDECAGKRWSNADHEISHTYTKSGVYSALIYYHDLQMYKFEVSALGGEVRSMTPTTGAPGTRITVTGVGFKKGGAVGLEFYGGETITVKEYTINDDGSKLSFVVPPMQPKFPWFEVRFTYPNLKYYSYAGRFHLPEPTK